MPKFFDNIWENVIIVFLGVIPLIFNCIGIYWKKKSQNLKNERQKFKQSKKLFIINLCSIRIKIGIMIMFCLLSIQQAIINYIYHQDYTLIIIVELFQIINYLFTSLQFYNDAEKYGRSSIVIQINLILQFISFCGFAIILFTWQNKNNMVIKHEDLSCWLMFLIRGILQFITAILILFFPQDKKLLQNIVSEFKYKIQNTNIIDENTPMNRQQLIANESHYTFGVPDQQQEQIQITNLEVNSFQDNQNRENPKKAVIYEISYKYQGKHKIVFRSFSEFLTFNRDLLLTHPEVQFPQFPKLTQYLSQQDIENRRLQLDNFLKVLLESFSDHDMLLNFLNIKGNCLQYKPKVPLPQSKKQQQQQQQQKPKKIASQPYSKAKSIQSLIPETIWEGQGQDEEEEESLEIDTRRKKKSSTYQNIQFDELDRNYQRFNSADNIEIDQQNLDIEKVSEDQMQFQDSSNSYEEEEKHSSQDMKLIE